MKEVKHQSVKKIPKCTILIIFLIVLLIGVGIFFLFIQPKLQSPMVIPELSDEDELVLFSCESDQLFSVMITPRHGEPYTLSWHNGLFALEGDDTYPLRQSFLTDLSVYSTYITALGVLTDLTEPVQDPDGHILSRADFGLQPAAYSALIRTTEGREITLYFGDYFEDGVFLRYYMATDQDNKIYVGSSDLFDAFAFERNMLHTVENPTINASLLDTIAVSGEKNFSVSRIGDYWYVTEPVVYPADEDIISNYTSRISTMLFSSWVGNVAELDLSEYGLDVPRLNISFKNADTCVEGFDENDQFVSVIVPGSTQTLSIGKDAGETPGVCFYCLYNDTVYIGTYFTLGFLVDADAEDFYLSNPVSYAANAIDNVIYTSSTETHHYRITLIESVLQNGQLETDPDTGEQVYSVQVSRDGTLIDSDAFLVWYKGLTQLSAAGYVSRDYLPEGEPVASISLDFGPNSRQISFYRYDPLHLSFSVDGTSLFYLNSADFEALCDLP